MENCKEFQCEFLNPDSEFRKQWREIYAMIKTMEARLQILENRKTHWNTAMFRMGMAGVVTIIGMIAYIYNPATAEPIKWMMYASGGLLFGDVILSSIVSAKRKNGNNSGTGSYSAIH